MADTSTRTLRPGYRCTCHHPGRRCNYQCMNTATVVRTSDGRPTCEYCIGDNPADSAGFGVHECYWQVAS